MRKGDGKREKPRTAGLGTWASICHLAQDRDQTCAPHFVFRPIKREKKEKETIKKEKRDKRKKENWERKKERERKINKYNH